MAKPTAKRVTKAHEGTTERTVQVLRQVADDLEQQMAEEDKKIVAFKSVKRKSRPRPERVAA